MFILESKHKAALAEMQRQRDHAASVAAALYEEKQTIVLFIGALLHKVGGRFEIPVAELVKLDGAFALSDAGEGDGRIVTLELVTPKLDGPPRVALMTDDEAEAASVPSA